ncbi:TonB family protein [Pedobacter sp. AW1-32]|uniref:TonB family protein n=1 Tax=Pedobacter sp. AW1-32 TaxID=3383026 RepID=UPI003FEF7AD7
MSFAHYLLQANLYMLVFYGFYQFLLSKETWFKLNRTYLLATLILSFAIPFLRFEWISEHKVGKQVYGNINLILEQVSTVQPKINDITFGEIVATVYFSGVIISLFFLIYRLIILKKRTQKPTKGVAFSFFSLKHVDENLPGKETINKHEEVHIQQLHSFDIALLELFILVSWFNPIIYLYKTAIKNIHEYLADEEAAKFEGDKRTYALLLLSNAFKLQHPNLANGFFKKSMIKKRIYMLQKERSKKSGILKYGLVAPLFAVLIILSSATIRNNKKLIDITERIPLEQSMLTVKEIVLPERINSAKLTPIVHHSAHSSDITLAKPKKSAEEATKAFALPKSEDKTVFDFVSIEKQPEFPGGLKQFYKYLGGSIRYPKEAQDHNIQGKVFLSFVVEKDGSLTDIKITRGLGGGTDEEAIRVLEESPKWNPGIQNGKAVRVKYNINVNFTLNDEQPNKSESGSHKVNDLQKTDYIMLKTNDGGIKFKGALKDGQQPLVVVDGIVQENNLLGTLNPKDIESINVLKSPNATALYGNRGDNGVILVTTKRNFLKHKTSEK